MTHIVKHVKHLAMDNGAKQTDANVTKPALS
jgi:hypothetical protein